MENKKAALILTLKFKDEKFESSALIKFDQPRKEVTFILNQSLDIEKIYGEKVDLKWEVVEEVQPQFRVKSDQIKISSEESFSELCLDYSGDLEECWYNVITKEVKALSWYSVWFPQELPFEVVNDEVIIENGEALFVVKGEYNPSEKSWRYGGKGFDPFNIIAYEKSALKTVSNENLNIYAIDESVANQAEKIEKAYKDILAFFNGNLFPKKEIKRLDIASTYPAIELGGGYQRDGLLFCDKLGDSDEQIVWLIAHETAHNWCEGADIDSYEDWLNEGTADWAALLYALHIKDEKLFDFIINFRKQYADSSQPLKPQDGSRSAYVHSNSTLLLHKIYCKYGHEITQTIVKNFVELETKTTEIFLEKIRKEIGDDVAEDILKGLQ